MATDRTRLVQTLREDEFQTVAQLSAALKIDEATVAGHLQQLEQDGLPLQSASDRGFRLLEGIAPIDAENLVEELEKAAFPYARQVEILDTVDSTSDWLSRQQSGGVDIHGKACITEFQSAGRGRRGRNWRGSPYCHLMFSMGWRFQKEAVEMTGLSLSVGVAVADSLRNLSGAPVGLKWPNDLWCGDRKLGGILVDLNTASKPDTQAIVGIGINLHEPGLEHFDPGQPVTDLASNVQDELPSRTTIVAVVMTAVARGLDRFGRHQFGCDRDRFNALDVFAGRKVRVNSGNTSLEGMGQGVDEFGRYRLRFSNGSIETIISGDLSLSLVDQRPSA